MGDERVRGRLQIQWHQTGIHLAFYCAFGCRACACGARLGFVAGKISVCVCVYTFIFLLGVLKLLSKARAYHRSCLYCWAMDGSARETMRRTILLYNNNGHNQIL